MTAAEFPRFPLGAEQGMHGMRRGPAHVVSRPSFRFRDGAPGVTMKCVAGCATAQIVAAVDLRQRDPFR